MFRQFVVRANCKTYIKEYTDQKRNSILEANEQLMTKYNCKLQRRRLSVYIYVIQALYVSLGPDGQRLSPLAIGAALPRYAYQVPWSSYKFLRTRNKICISKMQRT